MYDKLLNTAFKLQYLTAVIVYDNLKQIHLRPQQIAHLVSAVEYHTAAHIIQNSEQLTR
jgi:hypothetical protein